MSKKDTLKAELDWLKVWLTISVTALFAIIGWVASHYKTADKIELSASIILLVLLVTTIIRINKKAYQKMAELEDLE